MPQQDPNFIPDPNFVPDEPAPIQQVGQAVTTPLATFSQDPQTLGARQLFREQNPILGRAVDFGLGLLESQTAPLSIALGGSLGGGVAATKLGYQTLGRNLIRTGKVLSVPGMAQGAYHTFTGDPVGGIPEMLLSGAAMKMRVPTKPVEVFAPETINEVISDGMRINPVTGEELGPVSFNPPRFNPKGQTGMTGSLQEPAVGSRIYPKSTEPDLVRSLVQKGYGPGGVDEKGRVYMVKLDKPLEVPPIGGQTPSLMSEIYNTSRGMMSLDLPFVTSAAFRQAAPYAWTPVWFQSWNKAVTAFGSKKAFDMQMATIESHPLFKAGVDVEFSQSAGQFKTKRVEPFAQKAGLRMTGLDSFKAREEQLSSFLERLGENRLPGLRQYGKYVAASNRAYTAFLNNIRSQKFIQLVELTGAQNDLPRAKEIAELINNGTGRGTMRIGSTSLEQYAKGFSNLLFSPRNTFSRINIATEAGKALMSPSTYKEMGQYLQQAITTGNYQFIPKSNRLSYIAQASRVAATWITAAELLKMAGAEISLDPTSADFGKAKFGNTRIDLGAGYQQFAVLLARLGSNQITSSTTNRTRELGQDVMAPSAGEVVQNFVASKAHPTAKLFYDIFYAKQSQPVYLADRTAQMVLPMFLGDIKEVMDKNPELVPFLAPLIIGTNIGFGSQTYDKNFNEPTWKFPKDLKITAPTNMEIVEPGAQPTRGRR